MKKLFKLTALLLCLAMLTSTFAGCGLFGGDEDEICTKLFGNPSDWNYADVPPKLLLQYDPLDNEMDFLDTLDGFVYFFFGEDEKNFESITLMEEYT